MRRAGSFFLNRKLYISKRASAAVPFRVYHRNCTENAIIFAQIANVHVPQRKWFVEFDHIIQQTRA